MSSIKKLDDFIVRVESVVLVVVISLMVLLTFTEVLLKLTIHHPVQWLEMSVRYMVVWVSFLGGSVATAKGRHITIDVFSRYFKGTFKAVLSFVLSLIGMLVVLVLFYYSIQYLKSLDDLAFTFTLGSLQYPVKAWQALIIVPPSLLIIAWHFLAQGILALSRDHDSNPQEVRA